MRLSGPLAALAFAGLSMAASLAPAPALAGKAEVEHLRTYVGSWSGKGELKGSQTGTVSCSMTFSPGNRDKFNYQGRCAVAGTTISVKGTIAYIEAKHRYEAAMTSNMAYSGLAVGQRRGDGLIFNIREREKDEEGRDMQVAAAISLHRDRIMVDFSVVFVASGDTIKASIPFTK